MTNFIDYEWNYPKGCNCRHTFIPPFKIESAPGDKKMAEKLRAHLQVNKSDWHKVQERSINFDELLESTGIDKSDEEKI